MHVNICPTCHQNIIIPHELTSLIGLYPRSMEILGILYRNQGRLVHFSRFPVGMTAVRVHVSWIRQALKEEGAPWKIQSIRGEGYSLVKHDL